MNRPGLSVMALVMTFGGFAAAPAAAQESLRAGLDNCAVIRNAAERLFCFDSLAAGTEARMQSNSAATEVSTTTSTTTNSMPVAAARPPQQPATNANNDGGDFGLELEQAREGPQSQSSRYDGSFTGWTGDTVFPLENGQVWKQVESGRLVVRAERPQVTIRRGWFGAFYLKVEGSNKQIRVKRIK